MGLKRGFVDEVEQDEKMVGVREEGKEERIRLK